MEGGIGERELTRLHTGSSQDVEVPDERWGICWAEGQSKVSLVRLLLGFGFAEMQDPCL